jgi:hypothetical protein
MTPACNGSFGGDEMHQPISRRFDGRIGISVDGQIEDRATEFVAIGAEIGAATGQSEAQRYASTDGGASQFAAGGRHRARLLLVRRPYTTFDE